MNLLKFKIKFTKIYMLLKGLEFVYFYNAREWFGVALCKTNIYLYSVHFKSKVEHQFYGVKRDSHMLFCLSLQKERGIDGSIDII